MLRIKVEALNLQAEKYWYRGDLFNGIAYFGKFDSCAPMKVIDGELVGDFATEYFSLDMKCLTIDPLRIIQAASNLSKSISKGCTEISVMRARLLWPFSWRA